MERASKKRKGTKTRNCFECITNFPQNSHDND